jgi:hypothetical protein
MRLPRDTRSLAAWSGNPDGGGVMQGLPTEVVHFLNERIDSVPHLEALLIVWESGTAWDARQLSARVYLSEEAAQRVLQDLKRSALLTTEDSIRFRFDAGDGRAQELMLQVAATYRRNIARVATLIHEKTSSSVREFARAFDLKKDR